MPWCQCYERPRCERSRCREWADVSDWQVDWSMMTRPYTESAAVLTSRPIFMCQGCYDAFVAASKRWWHQLEAPANADEYWRPSIAGHVWWNVMQEKNEIRMRALQVPTARKRHPLPTRFVARLEALTRKEKR